MERYFELELHNLKRALMHMASIVETNFQLAIDALLLENDTVTQRIIEDDYKVNALEIEIDNTIVDILALHHPLASDLRLLVATLKINNDLERIGDHSVNIAQSVRTLKMIAGSDPLMEIPEMGRTVKEMLKMALDSFVTLNPDLAEEVLARDDLIDELNRKNTHAMIALIKSDTRSTDAAMELIRISRNLERVADLSTNIAEEVIFVTKALVVKHHTDDRTSFEQE